MTKSITEQYAKDDKMSPFRLQYDWSSVCGAASLKEFASLWLSLALSVYDNNCLMKSSVSARKAQIDQFSVNMTQHIPLSGYILQM